MDNDLNILILDLINLFIIQYNYVCSFEIEVGMGAFIFGSDWQSQATPMTLSIHPSIQQSSRYIRFPSHVLVEAQFVPGQMGYITLPVYYHSAPFISSQLDRASWR